MSNTDSLMYCGLFYACGIRGNKRYWMMLFSPTPIDEDQALALADDEWNRYGSTLMLDIDHLVVYHRVDTLSAEVQHDQHDQTE